MVLWRYEYMLNLVMIDTIQACNESTKLLGLSKLVVVFVTESYNKINNLHENSKYKLIYYTGDWRQLLVDQTDA